MVTLWHMKLDTTQIFDIVQTASGVQRVHTEVSPLSVEFDIDDQLMNDPASIQVNYGYNSKQVVGPPDTPVAVMTATPNDSSSHTYWRTNPARRLRPCDPNLNVDDPGCGAVDNTFNFQIYVEIPITTTLTVINQPPVVKPLTTTLGVEFYFPYDFTAPTNSDDLEPTALPYGVFHTMVIIPQGFGTPSVGAYKVSYNLAAKKMSLNYFPLTQDMRVAAKAYTGYKAVTSNLAKSGKQWMLHANNKLQPTVEGEDVSSSFKAWRYVRSWLASVGSDGNRIAGYAGAVAPGAANPDWVPDNGPDMFTHEIIAGWIDVPGGPTLPADPKNWPTVRQLDEFVATVLNYPEFGLIYYTVVWDVKPNAYRVRMSQAQSITVDQWCAMKAESNTTPHADESGYASGLPDTGWVNSRGKPTP